MSKMKEHLLDQYEKEGEQDSKAGAKPYAPERTINDIIKEIEEGKANV